MTATGQVRREAVGAGPPRRARDASGAAAAEVLRRLTDHPPFKSGRVGVLIVNLGTPEGTDYWSMRRYLKEFLSDQRVIEAPRAVWLLILQLILLTAAVREGAGLRRDLEHRARRGAAEDDHPIPVREARRGAEGLSPEVDVDWAMRYGLPRIGERLAGLQAKGCDRILVVPLYPQYCAATSATVADKVFDALKAMRWQPTVRVAAPWFDDPAYIDALARSTQEELAKLDFEPEVVLASFHGIPQAYFEKGDPYYCHCAKTTRLLAEELGWEEGRLRMTFQSRFGRGEWLRPYTDETVRDLAESGVKRIAVITPGFAADCLETLEEIAVENAGYFKAAGGERFAAIPCLNDGPDGMAALEAVAAAGAQGLGGIGACRPLRHVMRRRA